MTCSNANRKTSRYIAMENSFLWPRQIPSAKGLQGSLTSTLYRIAERNAISTSDFVRSLTSTVSGKPITSNDLAGKDACALEGCSSRSSTIVKMLADVPELGDLSLQTCWPLAKVLSGVQLLRRTFAWCPVCLERWRAVDESTVYQPLLWRFQHVLNCPIDSVPLLIICPYCNEAPRTFSGLGRVGCCANCGKWLGGNPLSRKSTKRTISDDEVRIIEILSSFDELKTCSASFYDTLNSAINNGMTTKAELRDVLRCETSIYKRYLPTIETVLRVSAISGITPLNLLQGNTIPDTNNGYRRERSKLPGHRTYDYDAASMQAEGLSKKHPELSLSKVCKQVGTVRVSFVRRRPVVAQKIRARHQDWRDRNRLTEMKMIESAIDSLIGKKRYPSWNAIKKECPGVYTDREYMEFVNELLAQRGFGRNVRGYLVAK